MAGQEDEACRGGMSVKLAVIGCGLMGSGIASLAAPDAELILIDREGERARALAEALHGSWSDNLSAAAAADIVAVVLPAPEIAGAFNALAHIARPGAILLDMATKGVLPSGVREARPDVRFHEARILGSGLAVSLGLKALLVLDTAEEAVLAALRAALPGFSGIVPGDVTLIPRINARGAYLGIRAAAEMEWELRGMGLPESWVKAASGCLLPGSALGYSQDRMGAFNRRIAEEIQRKLEEKQEETGL